MPFFKAHRDEFTGSNKKFISKDKVYKVIDFDITESGHEYAIIDDLGEEFWVSDKGKFSFTNLFYSVKLININYKNGHITIT